VTQGVSGHAIMSRIRPKRGLGGSPALRGVKLPDLFGLRLLCEPFHKDNFFDFLGKAEGSRPENTMQCLAKLLGDTRTERRKFQERNIPI